MNSEHDNLCSHRLDFSIRKSPDHGLLASPRGLSQLATSFIAFLRLGIHTRALSSLTIKFTQHTQHATQASHPNPSTLSQLALLDRFQISPGGCINLCFIMPVSIQLSKIGFPRSYKLRSHFRKFPSEPGFCSLRSLLFGVSIWWAWIDSNYRPHPYQGCALAT